MFETFLAAVALASNAQLDADVTARAISECGFAEFDVTSIDAGTVSQFEDFAIEVEAALGEKIMIVGGDLSGADMRRLSGSLPGSCFYQTKLSDTDWSGTDLTGIRFVGTDLSEAKFDGANLTDAGLIGVNASGASFADAKLGRAKWVGQNFGSKLGGARFRGADLTAFSFRCGITVDEYCGGGEGVDFAGATLSEADFSQYPVWGFDIFDGAKVDRTVFSAKALPYLLGLDLKGPIHIGSKWEDGERKGPQIPITPEEYVALKAATDEARKDVPAFDCAKVSTSAETLICAEYESALRRMDRDMNKLYAQARTTGKTTVRAQREWLRERDRCKDRECLTEAYSKRMDALFAALGAELALAPDAELRFQDDVVPVPDAFRNLEIYQRLAPAIAWASMQEVTLTGMEDGRILARGEAVGGNAHTCSLYGDALVYNPDSGWYTGELDDGTLVPILRVWDNRLFFRYSGNMGDTPDHAADFISCGARAGFGELRMVGK